MEYIHNIQGYTYLYLYVYEVYQYDCIHIRMWLS